MNFTRKEIKTRQLATDIANFLEEYEFYDFRDAYENMDEAIKDILDMLETCPEHIYNYLNDNYNDIAFMPVAGDIMNRIQANM